MERITTTAALKALRDIATEQGLDFTYERREIEGREGTWCVYVYDGHPDCLAGRALWRLGVTVEQLDRFNLGYPVHWLANELALDATEEALDALSRAQTGSDQGVEWGRAVMQAHRTVGCTLTIIDDAFVMPTDKPIV